MNEELKAPQAPKFDTFTSKDGKVNPVIVLNPGEKWGFSFGLTKAKLILANIDAIKLFVKTYDKGDNSEG